MSFANFTSYAKGAFASAVGLSTIGVGLLYYGQNYLIYPSHIADGRTVVPNPGQFGIPYEGLTLTTSDGIKIRGYLMMQGMKLKEGAVPSTAHAAEYHDENGGNVDSKEGEKEDSGSVQKETRDGTLHDHDESISLSRPTIVMFHGNGGNYGQRIPLAKIFYGHMRCNVAMLCYRGYGDSEGVPSEKGLKTDAQTILDYLLNHPVISRTKIILYGQSIGGAVAIDLASRNPDKIHAMIVENTFTSLPRLVPNALPFLGPFSWLCHQKWPSDERLPLIPPQIPIMMLSGKADVIVPPEHMLDLWEISLRSGRESGVWVEFPDRGHNDTCATREYWNAVSDFVWKVTQ
ncbi:alpha/beta-hydrolase [Sistotremastrum niveocremeum HHB9708]|uniref:Alpha/beta-hydrolase n=1 Tax=Sistotremastrum niveocremeum HHB9708 TaxID=1314777 RepID=A0A164PWU6_9AGAM|nr:alpha/beta-hydrolase [Sistotremastrum niveocremeum HHB9708]